jgi:nucleoside-diphosphate-sugar epimerase
MQILVTGATGFIGKSLVLRLIQCDQPVTLLLRESYASEQQLHPDLAKYRSRFEVEYADLRNYSTTQRAVRSAAPDHILHLAAAGVTNPFLEPEIALRHNIAGTLNLLKASFNSTASGRRIKSFVMARTPGELKPTNVYAASKLAAWGFGRMYALSAGWPIHGSMIFQAYGPDQPQHTLIPAAISAALSGEDFPMTAGDQKRDWIYIDDVVEGILSSLKASLEVGDTFELGTGISTSLVDVVQQIYKLVNKGGQPLPGALPRRPNEPEIQVADTRLTERLIGWQSSVSLDGGLQRLLELQGNL